MPLISLMEECQQRRRRLFDQLPEHSVVVLFAAMSVVRNGHSQYPYRQNSDFFYLTGFTETSAAAIFIPGRPEGEYLLFCQEHDPEHAVWFGERVGLTGAKEDFLADESYPIESLAATLPQLLADKKQIYAVLGLNDQHDRQLLKSVKQAGKSRNATAPEQINLLQPLLSEMRLFKSAFEQEKMSYAAEVSAQAHIKMMKSAEPGMKENHLQAVLLQHLLQHDCPHQAYPAIIGGGKNGCTLHYENNNAVINDGDLVLIDAGAEYDYYSSDITRTFPINGRFSPEQKAIYELVLSAQLAAIGKAQLGNYWHEMQEVVIETLTAGLVDLGILQGDVAELIKEQAFKKFYMHGCGHWLGLDVHDCGRYKKDGQWRQLERGMAFTVEPGLYIPAHSVGVDQKWWNIAVRIEDDILMTETGAKVLSQSVPKTISDIENIMAEPA